MNNLCSGSRLHKHIIYLILDAFPFRPGYGFSARAALAASWALELALALSMHNHYNQAFT